jgi:hypothetical protein
MSALAGISDSRRPSRDVPCVLRKPSQTLAQAVSGLCYWHRLLGSVGDVTAVMSQLFGEIGEHAFFRLRLVRHAGVVDSGRYDRDADDAF